MTYGGVLILSHYVDSNVGKTAFSVLLFGSLITFDIKKRLFECGNKYGDVSRGSIRMFTFIILRYLSRYSSWGIDGK